MSIRFDGRVALVTGAGNGIGKEHALALGERGAKVVVNDLGSATNGSGASSSVAEAVAEQIRSAGGEAMADGADVSSPKQVEEMVARAKAEWGRIDILVNNAGILRDKTFSKMDLDDYLAVLNVHLNGTVVCTKAVWETMREQNYGRIVLTSSTSGLYGNFGQAAYGVAKSGMLGLMNVLHLEGAKYNVHVNMLAPSAVTRMTEDLLPKEALDLMRPELITPGVLYLVSERAPSRVILGAAAGSFARIVISETDAVYFPENELSPEAVEQHFERICDTGTLHTMQNAFEQNRNLVGKAATANGLAVPF